MSLAPGRRERLLELARREDLVIVEDDVYRELAYDGEAPPALRALDPEAPVVRLGSFAKSLAPGCGSAGSTRRRTSAIRWPPTACSRAAAASASSRRRSWRPCSTPAPTARTSPPCASPTPRGATRWPPRCASTCRPAAVFAIPAGGFFIWVTLPDGLTASALLPVAERHRVGFAPGGRFCTDGDDRSLRLAFSLYDEATSPRAAGVWRGGR